MRPESGESTTGLPVWIITFADMMTLILGFFVLLYSFSSMEAEKFKAVSASMKEAFGGRNAPVDSAGTSLPGAAPRGQGPQRGAKARLAGQIREVLETEGFGNRGTVAITDQGVLLRLEGEAVFPSGSAELGAAALPVLDRLIAVAAAGSGEIEIEGHTDDQPIRSTRYPSNWELSSARAASAARYLAEHGVAPWRIRAIGSADARPLVPNTTEENRSLNRRVEFMFSETTRAIPPVFPGSAEPRPPGQEVPLMGDTQRRLSSIFSEVLDRPLPGVDQAAPVPHQSGDESGAGPTEKPR